MHFGEDILFYSVATLLATDTNFAVWSNWYKNCSFICTLIASCSQCNKVTFPDLAVQISQKQVALSANLEPLKCTSDVNLAKT